MGQNMGYSIAETTLWSDCPLDIVSQETWLETFNAYVFLFQKAPY